MNDQDHNEGEQPASPPAEDIKGPVNPTTLPLPEELPILPLHGFIFFPGMGFPLQITHSGAKQLIDDAIVANRMVGVSSYHHRTEGESSVNSGQLFPVGVMGYIHKLIKTQDAYQVLMSSIKKIRILHYVQEEPYFKARVEEIPMTDEVGKEVEAMMLTLKNQFKIMTELANGPAELVMTIMALTNPFHVAYLVASQLGLSLDEEQKILEIADLKELLHFVAVEISKKIETQQMSQNIQKSIKQDMDEKQKEFFLRQQLKAIQKELGEGDENIELEELKQKLDNAPLSKEARETATKELNRLRRISPSSPEYTVSRTYLDWILELPWTLSTPDSLDLVKAQAVLDADHYGLEKIKKRIIEFLAVLKLKNDMHGPILCFSGPPGVGKTSLGQSIARALNRKFVRISLGGIRDEAEIRGHRRTYIGSLPGRIIQSLKKAETNNPLFMLDEIDKLGMDFRGDPSSALLEVLDPEQNATFSDHYLEIPFDLSKVMFITTANQLDAIPGPLRDRMEVIELTSYTEEEKLMIAKRHLIGKQIEHHALHADDIRFDDDAIRKLIRSYTREAGVRNLERQIASVCRGVAKEIVLGKNGPFVITAADVETFLGVVAFLPEITARSWGPGLATGLAWTPVGGVLLFIETAKMPGKGNLILTGKLGDVMKESASAALTFIRSHAAELHIDDELFSQNDLHVHVPEGATPKDGPSAGVAMVVSLASLLTGSRVRRDIAMTGEITLRGDVLPVGGIKEKVLAAVRSGIKEIMLPKLNEKDIGDIPENARQGVTFHLIQGIMESLGIAFEK